MTEQCLAEGVFDHVTERSSGFGSPPFGFPEKLII